MLSGLRCEIHISQTDETTGKKECRHFLCHHVRFTEPSIPRPFNECRYSMLDVIDPASLDAGPRSAVQLPPTSFQFRQEGYTELIKLVSSQNRPPVINGRVIRSSTML